MSKNRINRRGGIQNKQKRHFYKQDFRIETSVVQFSNKPVSDRNIERTKAVSECLLHQMNVVNRLVRVQDRTFPIRSRKPEPQLVECLIYQTETLLNILERYVLPQLERTGDFHKCNF